MGDLSYALLLEPDGEHAGAVVPAFARTRAFGDSQAEAPVMARDSIGLSLASLRTGASAPNDAGCARFERFRPGRPAE
jgi:hypothetical protein